MCGTLPIVNDRLPLIYGLAHDLPSRVGWRPHGEHIDPELPLDQPMPCQLDLAAVQRQLSAQEFKVQVSSDPGGMQDGMA